MGLFGGIFSSDEKKFRKGKELCESGKGEQGLKIISELASGGYIEAQYYLGTLYYNGKAVAKDAKKALVWLEKAAEHGHADAQYNCAFLLCGNDGIKEDTEKMLYWLRKASEQGHQHAQYKLGSYIAAFEADSNMEEAVYWLKKSADRNNSSAIKLLSEIAEKEKLKTEEEKEKTAQIPEESEEVMSDLLFEGFDHLLDGETEKALECFLKEAEKGNADAQYQCGIIYSDDADLHDEEKAVYWLTKASENGIEEAAEKLASLPKKADSSADGNFDLSAQLKKAKESGKANDLLKAFGFKSSDTENNYVLQEKSLAEQADESYKKGDYAKALEIFLIFAEQGDADAQFNCGLMYKRGEGTPEDKQKALYWFEKAAEQGNAAAQFNCGLMYKKGEGTPTDKQKALYWFEKSAGQGQIKAQFVLALMYAQGDGIPADNQKALYWYKKAAVQGDADAQLVCGMMYEQGFGVPINKRQALYWYEKAAEQNNSKAKENADKIRRKL